MLLDKIVTEFLAFCKFKELSACTLMAYRQDLSDYQIWFDAAAFEDAFEKDTVLAWLDGMRARNLSPATIKRRIACLRVMFRWLEEEQRLDENPFNKLHSLVRLPRKLPRNLTSDELRLIFEQSNLRRRHHEEPALATLALSLELLLSTGIRVGELCAIKIEDVDISGGTIRIHGKGNRERSVFIVDDGLRVQIEDYLALRSQYSVTGKQLLFSSKGGRIAPDYIRKVLHEFIGELHLGRRITPHMFRHTAATRLLERGVDIRLVQKLLGHASISTTEIYTHVSDKHLKNAVEAAGLRRI
ncbi:tyrosine-type recombinase/integrase [Thalassospira xiamenensis]|uniref:tyrosine-type recombinase/integrase n=1 Tax=Thalassospira xiamenensis TaxID=220697 RepID=UPI003AA9713F